MFKEKVIVKGVEKKYISKKGETQALKDINFSIFENEFISIVGPSGCGKTTLLSIISGLIPPDKGEVYINGKKVKGICPHIGYMLQEDYLLQWRTVYDNIKLGLEIKGRVNKKTEERINKLLAISGLTDFKDFYPKELSGGMRQRVALARTLAPDPDILLLDEPFSSLDYQTKLMMEEELADILNKDQKTVILVTHDIAEAISLSNRVIILSKRPGKIKKIVDIEFEKGLTPLQKRNIKLFQDYFNNIWKELDINVQT
ncbi:ABC transporter ATP-binding protein [Halothermothrix orenii]|uniref:ABC transporter related n=1 Tax=Halothermothrix orenii (strain H 168 / OCM 544 / DSM 9562) TaxID=373903 RepID=B8CX83_HALOH|nr:ABC transporter ATP-binding protein [Halothermothrix orenii]ACL69902.1 ABC transporter related [Halothermothrix orenii H 168]